MKNGPFNKDVGVEKLWHTSKKISDVDILCEIHFVVKRENILYNHSKKMYKLINILCKL